MSYPKYLDDEGLAAFGFAVTASDPLRAEHVLYPSLSVRHRCTNCNIWSCSSCGPEHKCPQCYKGGRKPNPQRQFEKIYECCGKHDCSTMRQVRKSFADYGLSLDSHHDGFGGFLKVEFSPKLSREKRLQFHRDVGQYCISKFGGRKVKCKAVKSTRSKLPQSA